MTEREVLWHREERELTLDGEPVLAYDLSWPEFREEGPGMRRINRCYQHMARVWRQRWQREVYCLACLQLAQRRADSRPFFPWKASLKGQVSLREGDLLSLRLQGEEIRGDGRPNLVCWGDTWQVAQGIPCPISQAIGAGRGWRRRLLQAALEEGRARSARGECFLGADWEKQLKGLLPLEDYCLTPQGLELPFPQCTIAPPAEGVPVLSLPLPLAPPQAEAPSSLQGKLGGLLRKRKKT